jgi:anti-sigma factor RsiW
MSCGRIEELLPLYVDGDLAGEERRMVDDHLAACGACRESLAAYRVIESALVSRRELRPAAARTAAAVIERVRPRAYRYRRPLFGWIFGGMGAPGLAGAALLLAGIALYVFRGVVADFFAWMEEPTAAVYSRGAAEWTQWVAGATGGSDLALLVTYLGTTAIIMLAGSWMVLRLVRAQ